MRTFTPALRGLLGLAAAVVLLIGCARQPAQEAAPPPTPQVPQILRIGMQYDFDNLEPAKLGNVTSVQTAYNIFETLVRSKFGTLELEPGLAERWDISPDGKTFTFHLRRGVQFHKGYGEMTAEDVKFSLERLRDPEAAPRWHTQVKMIQTVEVVDPYTVRITTSVPSPTLLMALSHPSASVVPRRAVEELGDKFGQNPVGTGPFVFDRWVPQQETVLVRNPDYWGGPAKLEQVIFVPIPEAATMYMAFESGDIDLIQVTDPERLKQYRADPSRYGIAEAPGLITRFIGFNVEHKPFDDLRVRLAMQHAFNKEHLLKNVLVGISTPAKGLIPPGAFGYESDLPTWEYDPVKARQLLAEAGYPNGFKTQFFVPNIDRFIVPGTVFVENLRAIGVEAEMVVLEVATYLKRARGGDAPIFSHSLTQDLLPDRALYSTFHPDNFGPGGNMTRYSDPQVTAWLEEARTTLDEDRRRELFSEIQKKVTADAHYIFIDHENMIFGYRQYVKGFVADAMRTLRVYTVEITAR